MGLKKTKTKTEVKTPEGKTESKDVVYNPFYNSNVNLATGTFNLFSVSDPAGQVGGFNETLQMDIKAVPSGFTKWDFVNVAKGDLTVKELVDAFPAIHHGCKIQTLTKYGLEGEEKGSFIIDVNDVYLGAEAKAKCLKDLDRKVTDIYGSLWDITKGGPHRKYFLLDAQCISATDEPCIVPPIRFIFK